MAVTPDKPGPYTAASAILQFLTFNRSRGLPPTVSAETLARVGIPESLIPRTLQALQTLDLINDAGTPTPTLETLRLAPEAEYKARMADWLKGAYAEVLQFVDPAEADEVAVRDAFRNYNPVGQQPRMVSLFMALFAAAGIGTDKSVPQTRPAAARPRPTMKPAPRFAARVAEVPRPGASGLPPTITALLADLPPQGGRWTREKRDKFMAMFESMLDYNYKIAAEQTPETDEAEEEAA